MNISSLLTNKKQRFEALIRPHLRPLYRRAYRLSLCENDAEELVQELLLKLYEKHSKGNDNDIGKIENIQGWLMRMLYNLYIDQWRKEKRNPSNQPDNITGDNIYSLEGSEKDPLQTISQHRIHQKIRQTLNLLKPEQQLLIVMHDMEGHSLPELSIRLDIPLGTLKSRLHRTRQQMKENLRLVEPFDSSIRLQVEG